jgi:hypothetical protein
MGARAAAGPALSDPEPVEGESNGRSASTEGERDVSSNPALRINQKREGQGTRQPRRPLPYPPIANSRGYLSL